jgi:ribosome-associated toxin RatA of RatAB toxin-antitoxin module
MQLNYHNQSHSNQVHSNQVRSNQSLTIQFKPIGRWLAGVTMLGLVSIAGMAPVRADSGLFNSPVDQLPAATRTILKSGSSVVTGEKGKYVAQVLVTGSMDTAWSVLTDYNNAARFLPNVESNKVVETRKDTKIVEQVSFQQVFLFTIKSRVKLLLTESNRQRIDFKLQDSDQLQSMTGYWKIEPIEPYQGATPTQVLITQVVESQPKSGTPRQTFYDIFKNTLSKTMSAIGREMTTREAAKSK